MGCYFAIPETQLSSDEGKRLYFIKTIFIKNHYWKVFSPILNNISEQNHYFRMNSTVTNKIKHFPQLFALDPQIPFKQKWHHFLS